VWFLASFEHFAWPALAGFFLTLSLHPGHLHQFAWFLVLPSSSFHGAYLFPWLGWVKGAKKVSAQLLANLSPHKTIQNLVCKIL
jgi:hypothetical protein